MVRSTFCMGGNEIAWMEGLIGLTEETDRDHGKRQGRPTTIEAEEAETRRSMGETLRKGRTKSSEG